MTTTDLMYSKVSIMLVDDDSLLRGYLRTALATLGARVIAEVSRGNDVIDQYAKHAPDILFLDINLPDLDGHQVLKQVLQHSPQAFVVMVSGHSSFDNVKTALDTGAKGFIVKPFTTQKILDSLVKYMSTTQVKLASS